MQRAGIQPHAHLRPSVWAGRFSLGRFVLTFSVNRKPEQSEDAEQITNRLTALRHERGLSREELAARLQIHPSTVSEMERGRYLPSLSLALRVSELFAMPIEAIFSSPATQARTGEQPSSEEEEINART